jgi:hypothetical protein
VEICFVLSAGMELSAAAATPINEKASKTNLIDEEAV